ncbi:MULTISPECIES: D-ribose pyranase [Enterococcus]|uniref:D-ribose pyranase n=1 Tax=Enterococcus sulfureus ATCC 49903 TaxID=1140003 RepID=S0L7V8_9ENTE|nr:D-ribose pyranase [Enterococcus sulfureus]EOT49525.1 D-ribose pyranase [Enterococcus sulfureus ATCC 49903]EOT87392.1 D-ribose pyranase [Enterococcus sulfureus ATCC 49903]
MKKTKVINSDLSRVISQMGHFDCLAIGDAGMPVPMQTEKIDLALTNGTPSFIEVVENVLTELEVQRVFLAEEIKQENPQVLHELHLLLPEVEFVFIAHEQMKERLNTVPAFVRTGEMTPYANILLESGVVF